MEVKLKSGRKLKLKDISLDERDALLDAVEYTYKDDGSFRYGNPRLYHLSRIK